MTHSQPFSSMLCSTSGTNGDHRMKTIVCGAALALFLSGPVLAQNLPVPNPNPEPCVKIIGNGAAPCPETKPGESSAVASKIIGSGAPKEERQAEKDTAAYVAEQKLPQ
jgi:hypothetical protein